MIFSIELDNLEPITERAGHRRSRNLQPDRVNDIRNNTMSKYDQNTTSNRPWFKFLLYLSSIYITKNLNIGLPDHLNNHRIDDIDILSVSLYGSLKINRTQLIVTTTLFWSSNMIHLIRIAWKVHMMDAWYIIFMIFYS